MKHLIAYGAVIFLSAACATAERTPFDPGSDARIGAEVKRACFSSVSGNSGGYRRVGDRDAFVTGPFNKQYLLVFSRGCADLGPSGSFPVFRNYGDNCRRQGETVETASAGFGVTGACTIEHIYEWDEDAEDSVED